MSDEESQRLSLSLLITHYSSLITVSVRAGENDLLRRFRAGEDAAAGSGGRVERDGADGGAGLVLDALLVFGRAGPVGAGEAGLDRLLELVVGGDVAGALLALLQGALEEALLDVVEEGRNVLREAGLRDER